MTDDIAVEVVASRAPLNAVIFGSCVTRDTTEVMGGDEVTVARYIPRMSILSAGSNACRNIDGDLTGASRFQIRNVEADIRGQLLPVLARHSDVDVLLWDLVDERHGVLEFEDGSIMTRSIDAQAIPETANAVKSAREIPFASAEHFNRWAGAASAIVDGLDAIGMLDKVLVLDVSWAEVASDGRIPPQSAGLGSEQANSAYQPYFDHLRSLGLRIAEVRSTIADPQHQWGFAPFHYDDETYARIRREIWRSYGATTTEGDARMRRDEQGLSSEEVACGARVS